MLDKPSASDAKAALVPVVWTDCRASVCRPSKGAFALFRYLLLDGACYA